MTAMNDALTVTVPSCQTTATNLLSSMSVFQLLHGCDQLTAPIRPSQWSGASPMAAPTRTMASMFGHMAAD